MTLNEEWDRLDSETRQWLMNNPGCVLVPRTVTARIKQNSAGHIAVDDHGQMVLSREDLDFIRGEGMGADTDQAGERFRFFDAAQPGTRD